LCPGDRADGDGVGLLAQGLDLVGVGGLERVDVRVALLAGFAVELVAVLLEDVARLLCRREEAHVVDLGPASLVRGAQGTCLAADEVP
jgi:hypothetical protein